MRPLALGLLTFLVLVNEPSIANGLCNLQKDGTLAMCQYFEDIKFMDTYELKSLKVSAPGKRLSAEIFGNLTSLRHLDLSNGKLRKIEPETFIHLRALQSLDLSNNHLNQLEQGTLIGPKSLKHLNLRGNSLDQIPPDIDAMKNLKFLDISENKLYCGCKTLRIRESFSQRGIDITRETSCAGPGHFKGVQLNKLDADFICMFERQELEDKMQMDQPAEDQLAGSGEEESGDPFEELEEVDIPEEEEEKHEESHPVATEHLHETTSAAVEIPLTPHLKDDGMYFSEEVDKLASTLSATTSMKATTEASARKNDSSDVIKNEKVFEGSGEDDADEGSGIEGSGTGIVPPITWDQVEKEENKNISDESTSENPNSQLTKSTTATSLWWSIYDLFGSSESNTTLGSSTTTSSPSSVDEVNLAQDGFIPLSSTTEAPILVEHPKDPVSEIDAFDVKSKPVESSKIRILDESKSGKVQIEAVVDSTGLPDASSAVQNKKGMGSYLVLAVLLGVLATLIGYAAYRGDFCKNERKRSNRHPSLGNVENGTELKDLTKSLLDDGNSVQPKISSNGSKSETVPLVASPSTIETKSVNEPIAKYVGAVSDSSVDPVKPPRKSFTPNCEPEDENKNGTNGKISTSPDIAVTHHPGQGARSSATKDVLVNGKHDRDSLSSVGDTPSSLGSHSVSLSNQRLSQGPPSSPGAHRVKITLQENPDSVPKTPLLITRTKAGENLVKAP